MPLKPQEWTFKLKKGAFRAFKTRSSRGWHLEGSKPRGFHVRKSRKSLCQDFVLFMECKNRVLKRDGLLGTLHFQVEATRDLFGALNK